MTETTTSMAKKTQKGATMQVAPEVGGRRPEERAGDHRGAGGAGRATGPAGSRR